MLVQDPKNIVPEPLRVEPLLAGGHRELAAETSTPVERRRMLILSPVPAGIFHHGKRYSAEDRVLSMRASHRLVL